MGGCLSKGAPSLLLSYAYVLAAPNPRCHSITALSSCPACAGSNRLCPCRLVSVTHEGQPASTPQHDTYVCLELEVHRCMCLCVCLCAAAGCWMTIGSCLCLSFRRWCAHTLTSCSSQHRTHRGCMQAARHSAEHSGEQGQHTQSPSCLQVFRSSTCVETAATQHGVF